ncbi:S8 family serine peptidase [Hymenobacter ginsengisoli]|uniref:S8 family serine peptidase n=1 Tax=Hymenobacter ginsengisoli TaxID=1051626 RepID=A0ABP8Q9I2_9BACT|nr:MULTISPECIES: S8 family serine peptidase [unclassified Hymenobacter]MBO2030755.1 S8 family serine peptidase [Hymenobacter sp. BT559]
MKNLLGPAALLLATLLGATPASQAQTTAPVRRYFVYFNDKAGTPYTVSQPQAFLSARALARRSRQGIAVRARDLPVSPAYLSQVRAVSGSPQLLFTSRWLNGAALACDSATLARVQQLPGVRRAQLLSRVPPLAPAPAPAVTPTPTPPAPASPRATYGPAYAQNQLIGAVAMHNAGYRGEGMQIAVFDAGFPGANRITALQNMQTQGRVASTRNFVDGGRQVYLRNGHGTACLSLIGGELPGYFVGTAPHATFHLCITEDVDSESPMEEANWLAAAEYADSAGVDVISSSLGYNTFDDADLSHTYAQLNGRTAIASLAALGAARAGMVVVNSAGNDGNNSWHYIGVPADADSIITVGAVDSLRNHAGFSSYGPTADGRIKPTLSAMGVASAVLAPNGTAVRGNGTSYACPELAGLVAGFWQANPTLTAQQVIQALEAGASQAQNPDNTLGYGIADFVAAYNRLHPGAPLAAKAAAASEGLAIFPNPSHLSELMLALPASLRGQVLRVRVRDVKGALIGEQLLPASPAATAALRLPGRVLAPGTYVCTVQPVAGGATQSVRFVRQ